MTTGERAGGSRAMRLAAMFLAILAALAILGGCGVSGGDGDVESARDGDAYGDPAGTVSCYECHADGLLEAYATRTIFSAWLNGPHGNYESIDESHQEIDLRPSNAGFPYFGYSGLGDEGSTCTTVCHDQLGDGRLIATFYTTSGIDGIGALDRPVVGCESCHGSGADHFGIGDMPYPRPGAESCGQCHNADFPDNHYAYHPEGGYIYEDYSASAHATSEKVLSTALCSRCHTDEGARAYVSRADGAQDASTLDALMAGQADIDGPSTIQCRTCHDGHDPSVLLLEAGTDAFGNAASAEYRTCTACHQLLLSDGARNPGYHADWGAGVRVSDTHYDDPATDDAIEGYVVDAASESACRDCHNVHSAGLDINEQWAESAHGGHIASTYNATTGTASVTVDEAPAWVYYDFKESTGGWSGTGYQDCQKCHTATGFRNYADDPAGYDADDDDLPDTLNEYVAVEGQKEMLYCWACHTSSAGGLRDPGAIIANEYATAYTYPDLGGSNVCVSCHRGLASGSNIADSAEDFTDTDFVTPHYLSAAGTIYTATGYEYAGRSYESASYYMHGSIGVDDLSGTGENGPCVGCHMLQERGHTLEVVDEDEYGTIVGVATYAQSCSACHADEATLVSDMNTLRANFEAALAALESALSSAGFAYQSYYPYFTASDWTTSTDPTGKGNMGAAFNYALLAHEPGAYAHNATYARRLIYDSIDFLDDGALNSSAEATLGGSGSAYDYLAGTRP